MKQVVYGFGRDSRDGIVKVVDKWVLYGPDVGVTSAKYVAKEMASKRPLVDIYLVDSRIGLRDEYNDACRLDNVESWTVFRDMIVRDGLKVVLS